MVVSESDSAEGAGTGMSFSEGGLEYTIKANGTVEITGLDDPSITELTIPSSVTYGSETYDVTSIGERAFSGCTGLTSVTIPSSVTSIGGYAFYGCTGLTSVTIPSSVTSIGGGAFSACTGLTSVTILEGVKYIGYGAFMGCTSLTSVTIPSSVTSIGELAFYGCTGLTSVTIPSSVTSIGQYAFYNCKGLTSLTMPIDIKVTGSAFSGCIGLMSIVLTEGQTGKGASYPLDDYEETPWYQSLSDTVSVTISEGVTSIGQYAFYGCTGLTSVTMPSSITSIGERAFSGCTGLTSVTIPSSVTSIGGYAFYGCTGLTSVTIPSSVTSIGGGAFSACTGLTSVTILEGVKYIGYGAFMGCTSLTSVTIPASVTSIGELAFYNCTSLTSVTIPASVTSIGQYAFHGCTGLTSVTIPSSVTSIGGGAFSACTGLTSVTIPSSVTSIGEYAFYGCTGLTSVTIPASVKSISQYAFSGCTGLTSVTIPSSVTSIGNYVFSGCGSLTSVTIPSSVTSIGGGVFLGCTSLTSVTIPASVTSIGELAFYGCTGLTSVTIPSSVTSIGQYSFYNCKGLASLTIPSSVTSIGQYAFYNCKGLASLTMPIDIKVTGSAFSGCISVTSVVLTEGQTGKGAFYTSSDYTSTPWYQSLSDTVSVTISEGVTSIGNYAFYNCTSLTSVTIPASVTSIGGYAFSGCTSLTSVTIPASVTSIGGYAFSGCTGLTEFVVSTGNANYSNDGQGILYNKDKTSLIQCPEGYGGGVVIPDSVASIGGGAFSNCTGLTSVTIPSSVTSIGGGAFSNCTGLTSVTIPSSVTSIGGGAFSNCTNLTSIVFLGNAPTVGDQWANTNNASTTAYYYQDATGFRTELGWMRAVGVTVPDPPSSISSSMNAGEASLSWTAPAYNGGKIDGYEVWYGTVYDSSTWSLYWTGDLLNCTVTGLDPDTKYFFGVKATNFTGASEFISTPKIISFNANGGTGSAPAAITADYGSAVDLPGAGGLAKTGHTFGGWSHHAGGATLLTPYTVTANNETLFAVWIPDTYTITWSVDGSDISEDYEYGTVPAYSGMPAKAATVQHTYTFDHWDTAPVAVTGDATYTAVFNEVLRNYIVTYNINKGMGTAPSSASLGYGAALTLPTGDGMTRAGYTFGGWSLTSSGTAIAEHTVTGDVTLYVAWNIITYSEVPSTEELGDIIQQNDEPVLQIGGNVAGTTLDNTLFEGLGDKTLTIDVVDDEGQVLYSWSFAGDYKEGAGTFKADISKAVPDADLENAIGSTNVGNPLVLNFAASGELPINASVTYYVGDDYADGTVLILFFYNEETKQLEDQGQDVTVTDGKVTFDLTHCSSYVLAEPSPEEDDNTMLYIGIAAAAIAIIAVAAIVIRRR